MIRRLASAGWGQAVAALVLLGSLRLYTQALGPEAFGAAMLALAALALIDGIGAMAFGQTLAQVLKDECRDDARAALALGLGAWFSLWLALLMMVGLALAWLWLGPAAAALLALPAALLCAAEPVRGAGQTIALLDRRFGLVSGWTALEAGLIAAGSLAAIRLTGAQPAALVIGSIGGRLAATALLAPVALGSPRRWHVDLAGARARRGQALTFGWSVAIMAPLGWIGVFADRYLTGLAAGLAAAGVIAALAGAVSRPFAIASAGLTNLYRPDLLDQAAGRPPLHPRPLRAWLAAALAIGAAGLAAVAVLGRPVADFLLRFPTPGIDRAGIMAVLAASQGCVLLTHALDNQALARGHSRPLLGGQALAIALGLPVIAAGALWNGAMGAAWGRLANETLRLLAAALVLRWTLRPDPDPTALPEGAA